MASNLQNATHKASSHQFFQFDGALDLAITTWIGSAFVGWKVADLANNVWQFEVEDKYGQVATVTTGNYVVSVAGAISVLSPEDFAALYDVQA